MAHSVGDRRGKAPTAREPLLTTLGCWQADGTTITEVEAALARLSRPRGGPALRSAALSLLVLPTTEGEATKARRTIAALGTHRPAATLVVLTGPGRSRVDAEVRVEALMGAEMTRCYQEICLRLSGTARDHVGSVIGRLRLPQLPLVAWLSDRVPQAYEPLVHHADRLIVDSRFAVAHPGRLADLVAVTRRTPVTDLSWVQLHALRTLVAGLFDGGVFQPFVRGIRHLRVAGEHAQRRLLAGWLMSRLGLPGRAIHSQAAARVSVEILAAHDGRDGRFVLEPARGPREFRTSVEISGGPRHVRTLQLGPPSAARLLGQALTCFGADPVYNDALAAVMLLPDL